jgi:hypothetical protein
MRNLKLKVTKKIKINYSFQRIYLKCGNDDHILQHNADKLSNDK